MLFLQCVIDTHPIDGYSLYSLALNLGKPVTTEEMMLCGFTQKVTGFLPGPHGKFPLGTQSLCCKEWETTWKAYV